MNINRRNLIRSAAMLPAALAAADDSPVTLPAKSDFPVCQTHIELNNARWHPMSVGAQRAIGKYLQFKVETPIEGWEWSQIMQREVKSQFARLINAKPSEISFVPSTTAGENLVVAAMDIRSNRGNVVTDALHFEGSTYMYRELQKQGLDLRVVMPKDWRIELKDLEKVIDKNTRLVAVSLVSQNTGYLHQLKEVCDLAHAHGAVVYADAVQAVGAIPVDVRATGVDFIACASYKWLMGDMGLGFLYVREDLLDKVVHRAQYSYRQLRSFEDHIYPGDLPSREPATWEQFTDAGGHFEVGTISNTTVAALSDSLPYIQRIGVANIQRHALALTRRLQKEMPRLGFAPLTPSENMSPIVSYVVKDAAGVEARLKKARVSVRVSPHLIRISPSIYNDKRDIDKLLEALS